MAAYIANYEAALRSSNSPPGTRSARSKLEGSPPGKENPSVSAVTKLRAAAKVVAVSSGAKVTTLQGTDKHTVHSFAEEECIAFCDFINSRLGSDAELAHLLPISKPDDLFVAVGDGMLLSKLINAAVAETVDERAINKIGPNQPRDFKYTHDVTQNLNLAINAAKGIGLKVINIGPNDLIEGRPHLVLGLVWQIVKLALLSKINLKEAPFLIRLLKPGETLEELLKLPPEQLLMRWFNYHLERAGVARRVENFGACLADSELYAHLLAQIDPERKANVNVLRDTDLTRRAEYVVAQGQRLGAEFHVRPQDIVKANEKLNLGFVAALFNACPGLEPLDQDELALFAELPDDDVGDTREERAFRMWINSLGIERHVADLFSDVRDGVALLQTIDHLRPGLVSWAKVNMVAKMVFKKVENTNYATLLARGPLKFSLVGVSGKDITDGNRKLTLALIWQLMRYHLLEVLASLRKPDEPRISDAELVGWANHQVSASGRGSKIRDLSDKSLDSGVFLLDLLAAVEPRCVNYEMVTAGETEEDKKLNAKYAISCARKLGCSIFLLWEDVTEVRPKMVLSFIASVMAWKLRSSQPAPAAAAAGA